MRDLHPFVLTKLVSLPHHSREELLCARQVATVFLAISEVVRGANRVYESDAFLELAEPNIKDIIDTLAENKFNSIYVIPYFLYSGNHVLRDIPEIIEGFRRKYPSISLKLGDYLGIDERLAELVMERIASIKSA